MPNIPDRRRDPHLRQTIDEYRGMAAQARTEAVNCKDLAKREKHLALAKSLTELADSLQGRSDVSAKGNPLE